MTETYIVTGASTGLGLALTTVLAQQGRQVFAGVRTEEAQAKLNTLGPNIKAVILDVTNDAHIAQLSREVQKINSGPIILVNNAGVASGSCFELDSLQTCRDIFEVNYFGALKMIKTFLPLLRTKGGRIVNISSLAGVIAMPYLSAYSGSKFALEGASDSLRREFAPFGIPVVLVQPGIIATPIWQKGLRVLEENLPTPESPYFKYLKVFYRLVEWSDKYASPIECATKVIIKAIDAKKPKDRYLAGQGVGLQVFLYKILPTRSFDSFVQFLYRKMQK